MCTWVRKHTHLKAETSFLPSTGEGCYMETSVKFKEVEHKMRSRVDFENSNFKMGNVDRGLHFYFIGEDAKTKRGC